MAERKHIVILAAGDFPTHEVPLRVLREADFVVCCDSAYGEIMRDEDLGIKNYVVIGDGDSLTENDKEKLGDRWIHVAEQDYNDLHKAMDYATSRFSPLDSRFSLIGATGKRDDHTLGNISYLVTFAEEHPDAEIEMLTDYGRFEAITDTATLPAVPGQQVSIFAFDNTLKIESAGLKYPTGQVRFDTLWKATLNEALSDAFTLTLSHPAGVLLFFAGH